jgi:Na+/melibiose symporter-like transporter
MRRLEFSRVLAAEGVSNFGSMLSRLAIPWWAALGLQATPVQMSALLVADVLAAAVGGLLLAGWVDRRSKRKTMLACDVLRALLFAALALAASQGLASMPMLVVASALNGVLTVGFDLARSAWIAQRVPLAELSRRNAQLSATGSVSETLAFALGGWLYQGLGVAWALLVDGVSFLVSALCLRGVVDASPAPASAPQATPQATPQAATPGLLMLRTLWTDAIDGLRLVARHPGLRVLAGIELLLAAGAGLFGTSFMIFVSRDVGVATGPLGMVFAIGGLGALLGAWAAPALGRRLGPGRAMAVGLAVMAVGNACVPLVGSAGVFGLALLVLHQLVGDGGHVLHDIHDRTLRQTLVARDQLARADAGIRFAGQGATLAAALGGGLVGQVFGTRSALALAVGLFGLAALLAFARRAVLRQT